MPKAQGQVQNLGPIGERVAENVKQLRGAMTYRELSDELERLGRPIPVLGLSRMESKARRVDTDDLVALAIALGVNPSRLLLPVDQVEVSLTPTVCASHNQAWAWADGREPLWPAYDQDANPREIEGDFVRRARPTGVRWRWSHLAMRAAEDVTSRIEQMIDDDSEDSKAREDGLKRALARLQLEIDDLIHSTDQARSDLDGEH